VLRAKGRLLDFSVLKHSLHYTGQGLFQSCGIIEMNANRNDSLYTHSLGYVCVTHILLLSMWSYGSKHEKKRCRFHVQVIWLRLLLSEAVLSKGSNYLQQKLIPLN